MQAIMSADRLPAAPATRLFHRIYQAVPVAQGHDGPTIDRGLAGPAQVLFYQMPSLLANFLFVTGDAIAYRYECVGHSGSGEIEREVSFRVLSARLMRLSRFGIIF